MTKIAVLTIDALIDFVDENGVPIASTSLRRMELDQAVIAVLNATRYWVKRVESALVGWP